MQVLVTEEIIEQADSKICLSSKKLSSSLTNETVTEVRISKQNIYEKSSNFSSFLTFKLFTGYKRKEFIFFQQLFCNY